MTVQPQDGRAISLLSVILIVLLTLVSVLSAVAIVEYFHAAREPSAPAAEEKPPKNEHEPLEMQYEIAVHECGHAILNQLIIPERPIDRVWLFTERPLSSDSLGKTEWGDMDVCMPPEVVDRSAAIVLLGGLAAEQVILKMKPPEEYGDKDVAGGKILEYCEVIDCACPPDSKFGGHCMLKDVMRAERDRLYEVAVRCLEANKETLVVMANLLFRQDAEEVPPLGPFDRTTKGTQRVLDAEELKSFFETHPLVACPIK